MLKSSVAVRRAGREIPGAIFGEAEIEARHLDEGMGMAVARRTVFRADDQEDFGRVADRVAAGNISLLGHGWSPETSIEQARLRNAIASGALITSGRHLQHGDELQAQRNIEVFTNCATAIASFAKFYLLLNGSGVGRSYDDDLVVIDWAHAPRLLVRLDRTHPDFPRTAEARRQLGIEMGWLPWGAEGDTDAIVKPLVDAALLADLSDIPEGAVIHRVGDSREGWAKSVEILESMAFRQESGKTLVLDLSDVRPCGSPIMGMQGRPASGPISLARALINIRDAVIEPSRARDIAGEGLQLWEQALRIDHHLSVEVQVGGARRAARMATKSWRDRGILRFIRAKSEGGLWTANHSVMVDREFWDRVRFGDATDALTAHARTVFDEVSRCSYFNGEPGLINGDMLEDTRTGSARLKTVHDDGSDFSSDRYQADHAKALLAALSRRATKARFPVTTNPCGEISLHVTGGYCVIADFAPLLACPVPVAEVYPGLPHPDMAKEWDLRIEESVRLGVRFLVRANRMNALYGKEVARTNRIGIGPTGLHEWAWVRYGLTFRDLLDTKISGEYWAMLSKLSEIAKDEANTYSEELGMSRPATVTTVKPAGTTSKLFGITEGAHLPARRQYLRWVQFKGTKVNGAWAPGSDPLLLEHEAQGFPVRELKTFQGMSIVGFPTIPLIVRLGMGENVVTAPEATPSEQYAWLRLMEKNWIGADQGNQISYTLKVFTDRHDLEEYRALVLREQPEVRCCSVLPSRSDKELNYEYLPEEEVSDEDFKLITARIHGDAVEEIDMAHLQCAGGVCPL